MLDQSFMSCLWSEFFLCSNSWGTCMKETLLSGTGERWDINCFKLWDQCEHKQAVCVCVYVWAYPTAGFQRGRFRLADKHHSWWRIPASSFSPGESELWPKASEETLETLTHSCGQQLCYRISGRLRSSKHSLTKHESMNACTRFFSWYDFLARIERKRSCNMVWYHVITDI